MRVRHKLIGHMTRPSLSVRILIGLAAGLALGLVASATGAPWLRSFTDAIEPVGLVWVNLIRMCVIPLVVAALIAGVAAIGDVRRLGRVGTRTLGFMIGLVLVAELLGLALALALLPLAPVSAEAAAALRAAAAATTQQVTEQTSRVTGLRQFLVDLVPANPVKAAADGALLPLIVFSVALGAAVGTLAEEARRTVVGLMDALVAALIRLIGWVMQLAPIGVACLAAPVAARFGWEAIRSLGVFVVTVAIGIVVFALVVLAPAVRLLVRVPVLAFMRATAPGVTVGFTTTSSLAALPTMMETALNRLRISKPIASFVLPLGASVLRPGAGVYQMAAVVTVASLYGVHLGPAQYATALAACLLMTFSVPGIPSGTVLIMAPVLLSVGLPVEAIGLLLGVDRIPDMFRTGVHCAAHQTAAAVIARAEGETIAV